MKKLLLAVLFFVSSFGALADYLYDAKSMDKWQRLDTHVILLSRGSMPTAVVTLPYCYIYTSSTITILTDTIGNYDGKILVDSEVCEVREVKKI